jgi:hypothetical protein
VYATPEGKTVVEQVAAQARKRFTALRDDLSSERRQAALQVWANNFGVDIDIRKAVRANG